jgi:Flp pilus assembly protein TadG
MRVRSLIFRLGTPRLLRLARHEGGVAAVEFSLILPILVVLWIGGVEVTSALSVDRRLSNLAASIGDLVARSKTLKYSDVDQIFDIDVGAMYPYSATGVSKRISGVKIDNNGDAKVSWSRAEGTYTAYADNTVMNSVVPAALRASHNSQVIVSEVYYTYTPAVGYVITGNLSLNERMFFVPRLVQYISLCDNAGANCKS